MMVHLEVICSLTILTFLVAFATFFFAQVSVFALTGLDLDLFVPKRLFTKNTWKSVQTQLKNILANVSFINITLNGDILVTQLKKIFRSTKFCFWENGL